MQKFNHHEHDGVPLNYTAYAQQPQGYVAVQPVSTRQAPEAAGGTASAQPLGNGMAIIPPPPNIAALSGLEKLAVNDCVAVHQKVKWREAFLGYETENVYKVIDGWGQVLFLCEEYSSCCSRLYLRSKHPFRMNMVDPNTRELVLSFHRPFKFYFDTIHVFNGTGQFIGYIRKRFTLVTRQFDVFDHTNKPIFRIRGTLCHLWTFRIFVHGTNDEVGKITKKWTGLRKELFTDADNFGIEFPPQLTREFKGILVAATVLIDTCYFEGDQKCRRRHH